MNRLMRVDHGTKGCFLMLVLSCVVAGCASDVDESPVGRFFCRCVCFMLNLVTFSTLE